MTTRSVLGRLLGAGSLIGGIVALSPAASGDSPPGLSPVPVTAGATTSGIDLSMSRGTGSISGTLVDEDTGAAVVHAHVTAYVSDLNEWGRARSDAAGHFTIGHLPASAGYRVCMSRRSDWAESDTYPGQYALVCFPHSYRGDAIPSGAQPVPLAEGENKDLGTIEVRQGSLITGKVKTAHGNPLGHVPVIVQSLSDPGLSFRAFARNDVGAKRQYGRFAVGPLPPSPKGWQLCSDARDAVVWYAKPTDRFKYASTCYRRTPWLNPNGPVAAATRVKVAPGHARSGLRIFSVLAGGVKGSVSFPGGHPVSGFVSVSGPHDAPNDSWISHANLSNGRYKIDGLSPGRQRLEFCVGVRSGNYVGHCTTRTVRVRPHEYSAGPRLRLTKGLRLNGTVSDAASNPARVYEVDAFPAGASTSASAGALRMRGYWATAVVDQTGRYRIVGLAPSASGYYVCASTVRLASGSGSPASGCFRHGAWSGARGDQPVGAQPVKIKNGSYRTGVDFRLPQGGSISGTVTASGGSPIETSVFVYDTEGHDLTNIDSSPSDGTYIFESLSPGSYYVCAGPGFSDRSDNGACYKDALLPPGAPGYALTLTSRSAR